MKLWYIHMQTQLRSILFLKERNQSKKSVHPFVVSVINLNVYKTYASSESGNSFSLSAGENCTEPSNTQQKQETACVFIPTVSDPSHEVKSITATLTEMHNVSTLTETYTTEREGKWCSDQTFSTFRTPLLSACLFKCYTTEIPII